MALSMAAYGIVAQHVAAHLAEDLMGEVHLIESGLGNSKQRVPQPSGVDGIGVEQNPLAQEDRSPLSGGGS